MKKALERIEACYNSPLSIDELAKEVCLSRSYFLHSFKKAFGISPIQYQLQLRINAAQELLAGTSMPCKEIAMRVGMSNVYYFSRVFSNMTGMSPSQYRIRCLE